MTSSRLTVYRHFPNREALQAGMRATAAAEARAVLAEVEESEDADVFDHLVVALVRLARRHPLAMRRHRRGQGEEADPTDQRLAAVLARAQAAGVLRPDIPLTS